MKCGVRDHTPGRPVYFSYVCASATRFLFHLFFVGASIAMGVVINSIGWRARCLAPPCWTWGFAPLPIA